MMKEFFLSVALMLAGFQTILAEPFLVQKRGINDLFLQDGLTPNSKVARQFPFDHGKVVYNGGRR